MGTVSVVGWLTLGSLKVNVSTNVTVADDGVAPQNAVNAIKAWCNTNASPYSLAYSYSQPVQVLV